MRAVPVLVIALLTLPACGGGGDEPAAGPPSQEPLEVRLSAENRSGLSGTARLSPAQEDAMRVVVTVEGATNGMHTHIHDATCAEYRRIEGFDAQLATVSEGLADFQDGRSETTVTVLGDQTPLAARATGGYSINVHQVAAPYDTVACGDIPER